MENKNSEQIQKKSLLKNHILPAFGNLLLEQVVPRKIAAYKAAKLDAGLARKTVNNHLALLRKMLNTAVEWELLDRTPKVKALKVAESKFDFLDFDELDRLLYAARSEGDVMLLVIAKTGLRIGELRALQWDDVDLVAKRLVVRRNLVHGKIETPKSGKNREIPLCDSVVEVLQSHRHLRGDYVFCDEAGIVLSLTVLYSRIRFYCRKAGLRKIGFHTLRHTFASHLAMKGVPLKVVQELLGHSTIEMTMRYAHLSPGVKREYVKMLDEKFRVRQHMNSTSRHDTA